MRNLLLGLLFAAILCIPARADEPCPVQSHSLDDIVAKISSSPDCARAYAVMNACLFTASGDVALAKAVADICEPRFLDKLPSRQRRLYASEVARCRHKHAGQEGSMYVSFAATCEAGVAADYAKIYGK
jgi:hypothetical protein